MQNEIFWNENEKIYIYTGFYHYIISNLCI